jgi:hypothetical protein
MGKPVWTLLPFVPDWRWLLNRNDSPWYPSMRLFRQTRANDWAGVFKRLKQTLLQEVGNLRFRPTVNQKISKPKLEEILIAEETR